jgi:hypothetical protein
MRTQQQQQQQQQQQREHKPGRVVQLLHVLGCAL